MAPGYRRDPLAHARQAAGIAADRLAAGTTQAHFDTSRSLRPLNRVRAASVHSTRCLLWVVPASALLAGACTVARRDDSTVGRHRLVVLGGVPFDSVFRVTDSIALEETPAVVTVAPRVTIEPNGGFLVADEAEHQVRRYTDEGTLQQVLGSGTGRPDSIRSPGRARRLADGSIAVVSLRGSLSIIPPDTAEPPTVIPLELRTARDIEVLANGEVVIVGSDSSPPSATLFPVDLRGKRRERGFFPPPRSLDKWVTTYMSSVQTSARGSSIAAVHMLSDTLFVVDGSGHERLRIRIPIDSFVAPRGPLPDVATTAERYRWTSQFTLVMGVFWVADDEILVQWAKPLENGIDAEWALLAMDTLGRRRWAIAQSPILVAAQGDDYFFRASDGQMMNRWAVAHRRR